MPRGIPNPKPASGEAASLQAAIAELQERLERLRDQERGRRELVRWLAARPALTKRDVRMVADTMNRHGGFPTAALEAANAKAPDERAHKGKPVANSKPAHGKVGKAVRAARLAAGWSTTKLSEKSGCGTGHISMIELGKTKPGPKVRERLAAALGIPATALANGDARP